MMDKHTTAETILSSEHTAMQAWLNGNPSPFLELYSEDITYFDPAQGCRLDGWNKVKELYESMRGKMKIERFEMLNPVVQSTGNMAVLSYNLHMYSGQTIWKENCTEVYRRDDNNGWQIIHCHFSPTQPSAG